MLEHILLTVSIIFGSICLICLVAVLFIEDKIDEVMKIFVVTMIIALGSILWWLFITTNRTEHNNMIACSNVGGKYIVTGQETTYVMVGKVMSPMEVDVYGCVKQ